tara:strand:+ start:976 stop:1185 length:210 start_codon:yes stop_codon:yes gene_type:complete
VTFNKEHNVYVIPVANCLKVCIDKETIEIPMTKEDYGNFAWEVMRRWRESDDKVRLEDFKIYKELHKEK